MSDVPLSVGIRTMSVNGLQGVKGTEQRHDDEMRGYMSDIYANYIQFFRPFDARDGIRQWKMLSPSREVGNNFQLLGIVQF